MHFAQWLSVYFDETVDERSLTFFVEHHLSSFDHFQQRQAIKSSHCSNDRSRMDHIFINKPT